MLSTDHGSWVVLDKSEYDGLLNNQIDDSLFHILEEKGIIITKNNLELIENDYIVDFEHPEMGHIRIPGLPIYFSQAEVNNTIIASKLGEYTDSVLKEICGYSEEDIARFRRDKII